MADVKMALRWMRCPTCQSVGYVHGMSTVTPPTVCPNCRGECRVSNIWYGVTPSVRPAPDRPEGER